MEGFTKADYDYFRTQGFEVVKSSMGKYYVLPCCKTGVYNQVEILEAKDKAIKCGFAFDSQGDILGYTKPKNDGRE